MNNYYIVCLILFLCLGCSATAPKTAQPDKSEPIEEPPAAEPARNPAWAEPIVKHGLPNFNKINDTLYRGGQPTAEGMQNLKMMGIKTIINLRSFHSDREEIGETGLAYEHIYMKAREAVNKHNRCVMSTRRADARLCDEVNARCIISEQ